MNYLQTDVTGFQVELTFHARKLKDVDIFTKSDPFVTVYFKKTRIDDYQLLGNTQTQNNTLNPNWNTKFLVEYVFQQRQLLSLEVYDDDGNGKHNFIGRATTTLGNVMGARYQTLILDLEDRNNLKQGKIVVRGDQIENSTMSLKMRWRANKLANMVSYFNWWDKSSPYLKFLKIRKDDTFQLVYQTQTIPTNLDPVWQQISIPLTRLIGSQNPLSNFRIQCWHEDKQISKHKMIGYLTLNIQQMRKNKTSLSLNLQSNQIKNPGILTLLSMDFQPIHTFIDYLKSGLQINMVTAIDFTGSNGNPNLQTSLHYTLWKKPTQYQIVINSIWDIIQSYDYDKKIPAYGFGAKVNFKNINFVKGVSHCFNLNDNPNCPQIQGLDNLMKAYIKAIPLLEFSGPTCLAPLIKKGLAHARKLQGTFGYQVMVILTDGQIHDMPQTKDLIVNGSNLPLSIIIVGIGNGKFDLMKQLDGDKFQLDSKGKKRSRDIIQFVPFNRYKGDSNMLTKQLLKQIPGQVVQYFKQNKVNPKIVTQEKV